MSLRSGLPSSLKIIFLTFIFSCLISRYASATHIMGADIHYEWKGGNTYEFTLSIYRDCGEVKPAGIVKLFFTSPSCGFSEYSLNVNLAEVKKIPILCPSAQAQSSCNGGPFKGVEQYVFKLTHTLPAQCSDWRVFWKLCCRNNAITNSQGTGGAQQYVEATINNLNNLGNSSPYFTTPPVPFVCVGEPFNFNNGAIDPDGDSLTFELINPLDIDNTNGSTTIPIPYTPGFSKDYPISTIPANSFNFDPVSGQFNFTPAEKQEGIVAMLVKEYRDGQLIGTTMRDIQVVVLDCANKAPTIDINNNANQNTGTSFLNGNTFSVCLGSTLDFVITASDPNAGDLLQVSSTLQEVIPEAQIQFVGQNPVEIRVSWTPQTKDLGNYFFSVSIDDGGCPLSNRQVLGYKIIVQNGAVLPPKDYVICPGTNSINLNSSIPDNGGTFSWSPATGLSDPAVANPIAQVNGPIDYTVSYIDNTGCPIVEPVSLVYAGELSVNDSIFRICENGVVNLEANFNGNLPNGAQYSWSPTTGLDDPNVPNPIAGPANTTLYTVTVNALGCTFSEEILVTVDQPLQLGPYPDVKICQGNQARLLPANTLLPISEFQWQPILGLDDPNLANPIASPTTTTNYTLTATNACGVYRASVPVSVSSPLNIQADASNPSCPGEANGEIRLSSYGGDPQVSYTWLPAVSDTNVAIGIPAGVYEISALDASGCTDDLTVLLSQPEPLVLQILQQREPSCTDLEDGLIELQAQGGNAPYQYSIDGGTEFWDFSSFDKLGAGNYSVLVKDSKGCTSPAQNILLKNPLPLTLNLVEKVNTDCFNQFGSIAVEASGGTFPYSYSLDGENYIQDSIFATLGPGTYLVNVRDQGSCIAEVEVQVLEITNPQVIVDTIQAVSCAGKQDGFIEFHGKGGVPAYLFSLDNGAFTPDSSFRDLEVGRHTVRLEDRLGCTYDLSFDIEAPDTLTAQVGQMVNPACFGVATGELKIFTQGGAEPLQYAIDNGVFQSPNTITGLPASTYTIRVKDSKECEISFQTEITEPAPLRLELSEAMEPTCYGSSDGRIRVFGIGGTAPYQYGLELNEWGMDSILNNLGSGQYQINIRDANECLSSLPVQLDAPDSLMLSVALVKDIPCFGARSGELELQGSGGVMPYEFSLDNNSFVSSNRFENLSSGTYAAILRDANSCLTQAVAEIAEGDPVVFTSSFQDISCFGDSNGVASVAMQGGTPPFTYIWSNGASEPVASGLGPGPVEVQIFDSKGCESFSSFEIHEPPEIIIDTLIYKDLICFGEQNGEAEVRASGGQGELSYVWDHGASDSLLTDLSGGTFYFSVIDSLGCFERDSVDIFEPDSLAISTVESLPATCDEYNGSLTVAISGGTPAYDIFWSHEPNLQDTVLNDLKQGVYYVQVMDSNSCLADHNIIVDSLLKPRVNFATNYSPSDTILFEGQGINFLNDTEYSERFEWSFGDGEISRETSPEHFYESAGQYRVILTAYDSLEQCPVSDTLNLTLIAPGGVFFANAFSPNGDGKNDLFMPVGSGVEAMNWSVFDRWGRLIKKWRDGGTGWDGNANDGLPAAEGVYTYIVKAQLNDGTQLNRTGTVTLLR